MVNVQVQNQSHSSEGALSSLEEALSDRYAVMVQLHLKIQIPMTCKRQVLDGDGQERVKGVI
jgi:hypothetical protein